MYIVLFCENVMSLGLFEKVCWLPYFEKCKLYIQVFRYVLYAAVMLLKFYKITSLQKEKNFIRVLSKQHGFASQDALVVGSKDWGFCGVADAPAASRGEGVTNYVKQATSGMKTNIL